MQFKRREVLLAGLAMTAGAIQLPLRSAMGANISQSAAASDPIQRLDSTLIDVMKNAQDLKFTGRYARLEPVLASVFDIPEMTRIAVGPKWKELSDADQSSMSKIFGRYMTTMYASRFNAYGGESFEMAEVKPRDDGSILVSTRLMRTNQEPVELSYLMRGEGAVWHAVDVYYNGSISQMAQLRSEFSAPLRDGGTEKLRTVLETKIQQLQGGA